MNKKLIKVLAYDRFHNTDLTWLDRILIHQHIAQDRKIDESSKLHKKVADILLTIWTADWQIPEYRFNAAREIEIKNPNTNQWEVFNKKEQ